MPPWTSPHSTHPSVNVAIRNPSPGRCRESRRSVVHGSLWTTSRGAWVALADVQGVMGRSGRRWGGGAVALADVQGGMGRSQRRSGGSSGVVSATPVGRRRVSVAGGRPPATSEWCGRPPLAPEGGSPRRSRAPGGARGRSPGSPLPTCVARRGSPGVLGRPRDLAPEPTDSPGRPRASVPRAPWCQGEECARFPLLCSDAVSMSTAISMGPPSRHDLGTTPRWRLSSGHEPGTTWARTSATIRMCLPR